MFVGVVSYAQTNAKVNFVQPTYMHYGYLSSSYVRDVYYEADEEGNIYLQEKTDAYIVNEDGDIYNYISMTKPSDYYSAQYIGIPLDLYNSESDMEENRNKVNSISNRATYYASLVDLKDGETVYGTPFNDEDLTNGVTTTNKVYLADLEIENATLFQKGDVVYRLVSKYEFKAGQYYVYAYHGELKYNRVTVKLNTQGLSSTLFTTYGHDYYVKGTFDGDYKYENDYPGNKLEFKSGNYYINGNYQIAEEVATYNGKKLNYIISNTEGTKLGYDYFDKIYFTANGTPGLAYNGKELVKYATFGGPIKAENITNELSGKEKGIDYVVRYHQYEVNSTDVNGNPITSMQTDTYYYFLQETAFSETGEADKLTLSTPKETIIVAVYPGTFINPYISSYSTLKNSTTTHDGNSGYYWKNTTDNSGVAFAPTYYLYEGGYEIIESGEGTNKQTKVYIACDENYDSKKISLTDGVHLFTEIRNNWSTYKDQDMKDYVKSKENGSTEYMKLSELYYVDANKKLYMYNSGYVIKEGLLYAQYIDYDYKGTVDMYEGMYLTNSRVNLYTRYKYSTGDGFETSEWGEKYMLVPPEGQLLINSGTTKFSESARVILSGTNALRVSGDEESKDFETKTPGKITIQ